MVFWRLRRTAVSCFGAALLALSAVPTHAQEIPRALPDLPDIRSSSLAQRCPHADAARETPSGLSVALQVAYGDYTLYNPNTGNDDHVHLRSYDGCPTGPVIDIAPGKRLSVKLTNTLPVSEPTVKCPVGSEHAGPPHCFNTTNLHLHGLHVSPSGQSDNVFTEVEPGGGTFQYAYDIPANHPSGTFWYHSHNHGSTAIQVSSGMEGVMIVRGSRRVQDKARNGIADLDTILVDPTTRRPLQEQTLLFQQIEYGCFDDPTGVKPDFDRTTLQWTCGAAQSGELRNYDWQLKFVNETAYNPSLPSLVQSTWAYSGHYTQINGVVQPSMPARGRRIAAGEIQRWRLVHGGVRDSINMRIVRSNQGAIAVTDQQVDDRLAGVMSRLRTARTELERNAVLGEICTGETVNQVEIALDGLTRPAMVEKTNNFLHPGQRSDVLVAFPAPGLYCVLDDAAPGASTINFQPGATLRAKGRKLLSFVRVGAGAGVPKAATDGSGHTRYWQHVRNQLVATNRDRVPAPVLADLASLKTPEYAPVSDIACPASGCLQRLDAYTITAGAFGINGHSYTMGGDDPNYFRATLGQTYDWTVRSTAAHVFHVHVNPVEIVDVLKETVVGGVVTATDSIYDKVNGGCKPQYAVPDTGAALGEDVTQFCDQLGAMRDTVFIKGGYRVVMRTRFEDFTGTFVMHCHILDHEDFGMMMAVDIVAPGTPPGDPGMPGMPMSRADEAPQTHGMHDMHAARGKGAVDATPAKGSAPSPAKEPATKAGAPDAGKPPTLVAGVT